MRRQIKRWGWLGATALLFATLVVPTTWAKWAMPTQMPVARLLKNVGDYVKAHPRDARGYYTLGRINSAAFAQDADTIGIYPDNPLPYVTGRDHQSLTVPARDRKRPLPPRALTYLADAIRNYQTATTINASDGLAWLGLGFQCEEALPFPQAVTKASAALGTYAGQTPEKLRQTALKFYRKAYSLTVKTESEKPLGMDNPVSMEAAQGILRLQQNHPLSAADQAELTAMQKLIASYQSQGRPITPILISFDRHATLTELLAPETRVRFDLAGDGLKRSWPWVKPTTGILVWDSMHTGKITSGLQLFGSVTWWLFWKDGYEPLNALDNSHNGWLEGGELQGIAVWFDRNSNGVADAGEVVPLSALGIKRIATHSTGLTDGVPANLTGVRLKDGSSLPTFDWTPTSATK